MGLLIRGEDMGHGGAVLETRGGGMKTLAVFGRSCSLMVATREAGYHSRPHRHRSEQVNYVTEGEIWVFIEKEAFLARAGDFYRIPGNAVHWGWNLGDGPVGTFQAFAPAVDPYTRRNSTSLLTDEESDIQVEHSLTEYLEDEAPYLEFEQQWYAELKAAPADGES